MWRFDALQAGQTINQFGGEEVMVAVSAARLVAQGLNPQTLNLWTRPDASHLWTRVQSEYDPEAQVFKAWLPHFSEFSLGQGLVNAEVLPSVKGFTSDRVTGGATIQYPIETPKGLGSLAPDLSFSYSSVSMDDLFQNGGDDGNHNTAQVSGVGAGWNLGGISRIVRAGGSLDNATAYKDREYVLTLNHNFVRIKYEGIPGTDGAWHTDPEIFAKIERIGATPTTTGKDYQQWQITTSDGVHYLFGDPNAGSTFSATSATATFVERQQGGALEQLAKEWYLVQVDDTLGNRMAYHYQAEQAIENGNNGCVISSDRPDLHWYTGAIYPTDIVWSSHVDATHPELNVDPKLLVQFVYNPTERADTQVDGADNDDCQQAKFGRQNQLAQVVVQAAVQTANNTFTWQSLHSYTLLQRYGEYRTVANESKCYDRLLLEGIEEYGAQGGLLQKHSFAYENDGHRNTNNNCVIGLNSVRLVTADNGVGGKIYYTYQTHRISCANSVCGDVQKHVRHPVIKTAIEDGLDNTATTTYCYGPTDTDTYANPYCADNPTTYQCDPDQQEWGAVENSGEYMGFCRSEATYFVANATDLTPTSSAIVKWDRMDTWQGARDNPDPRRGKTKRQEVRTRPGGDLLAVTANTWNAYRRAYTGCTTNVAGWCMSPTASSWHQETSEHVYHTLWLRLEATSAWQAGVGSLTRQNYAIAQQNNQQFGNVTEVQEWSHAETTLDNAAWQTRVLSYTTQLQQLRTTVTDYFPVSDATRHIVNKPARVRIYAGANTGSITNCKSETRTIYDDLNGNYNTPPVKGWPAKIDQAITGCSDTPVVTMYSTLWTETRMAYDTYGNQIVLHHVGGSTVDRSTDEWINTTYDTVYHLFPIQQQQTPTNFTETASYYGVNGPALSDSKAYWGAMAEHCAINGVCTRQAYDEFGRHLRRWDGVAVATAWWPDNAQDIAASVLWNYRDPVRNPGFKTTAITEWHAPRCEGNFVRKHYNGLGQLVAEQKPDQVWQIFAPTENCNNSSNLNEIETLYAYDSQGNQVHASAPYRTSVDWIQRINAIDWQQIWSVTPNTQIAYDALSRPITTTLANGAKTVYQTNGRDTKTIGKGRTGSGDPDKLLKWQEVDGLGQPRYIRTGIWNGADWTVEGQVTLVHDVTGNLTCVYQPFATTNPTTNPNCSYNPSLEPTYGVVNLAYDRLGHKTSMFDGDLGNWYYQYDRQGHLYYQAGGTKFTCLYYDAFGRLKGKLFQGTTSCATNPDPNTFNVRFGYDENQSDNNRSLGQLTSVAVSDLINSSLVQTYLKNVRYDSQGRLASEAVTIQGAGKTYTTTYTYDAYQRPQTVIYPDHEVVTTTYNSMGLANTLRSNLVGTLVDGTTNGGASYDEADRLTTMRFPAGGNLWHTNTYAPWGQPDSNGGLLTNIAISSTPGGQDRLALAYAYDSFANIKTLTDVGTTSAFTYDAQNRLTDAFGLTYAYDAAGRLTNYEGTTLRPNELTPHVMQKVNKTVFTGSTGNLAARDTERGSPQYLTWDEENHLQRVTVNNNPLESYGYDADGGRVKKSYGGVATYYVNPYYEITGPDLPAGVASAALASGLAEPGAPAAPPTSEPQLFLPLVAQNSSPTATLDPALVYYRDDTGATCTPGNDAQCVAWVVTTAPTAPAPALELDLSKLQMRVAPTDTLMLTLTQMVTEGQQLWPRAQALLPGDQIAPPGEWAANAETEIKAAALLTLTNPGFQLPNTSNTNAANWSTISPDTSGYPATAIWWQNWGTSAGHDNPSEGGNSHYAYSISNLASGWLESSYIGGLQAGQQYDFAVDLCGALDPTNTQGTWLVRAAFYNNSSQAVGAPVVAVQGGAAALNRFNWQRVSGRITVPAGATKVKLQLVSQLNGGWVAFDNVAFTLVGASVNLAPSPGFEDPAAGQMLGWSEVRSAAHPGTGFYRTDQPSPWSEGFATKAYLISNLAGGWLESADMAITPGQTY
ncbi:MAG: hypothetical protein NT075_25770, partial [Chloroflexi bacterium]|nr:hypothetical protein [Chloroflexota bacterium]